MPSPHLARWFRVYAKILLWIVLASVVPPALLLTLSYYQTLRQAEADLNDAVTQGVRRVDSLLKTADLTLTNLAADIQHLEQLNDEKALRLVQRVAYKEPRFREVGIIDAQGSLVLTSLGIVEPPISFAPETRADLDRKVLQIVGPVSTRVMQERSIVLVLPTEGQGEVNILVDPIILTAYWGQVDQLDLGQDGFLAYVNTRDGQVLAGDGIIPPKVDFQSQHPPPGYLHVQKASYTGDVVVVGQVSKGWALRNWRGSLWIGAPLTGLGSALMMLACLPLIYSSRTLKHEIENALKWGEFQIHYQPILDIQTGYCVGAEALIRWCHPQEGLLLPSTFIGIAEATGLINAMSTWVCQQVMQDQALLEAQYPDVYISINISPVQLNSGDIEEVILTLMTRPQSYPGRIVVEVTEAALVEDTKTNALSAIARLHSLGIAIALDDFGTGYSNLGYLHKFHLDYLKIDRIFVTAIKQSSRISAVVDAVIDLGRNLGVELIAEGVETQEQLQFLKRRGVRYAQGYLLAHPMPIKAFQIFLAQNRQAPFALKT
ncbi:EAL domain-containing protein [Leptolyngbya sp. PCC 6406]|uniref:EAL domain-containing protein n=1 Tax=Leptolyngbya sp. PCC 6406 TaxID=1173264 RepID=UPI0002ACA3EB|nr:EAL domain-containing protein [Leptolyngbya sp. PCC 6406]